SVLRAVLVAPVPNSQPSLSCFDTVAVRRLLGAVAAHRHVAPPSCPPAGMVREPQSAVMALARLDVGKVFVTNELRQHFADRQKQRLRRSPAPDHAKVQRLTLAIMMS